MKGQAMCLQGHQCRTCGINILPLITPEIYKPLWFVYVGYINHYGLGYINHYGLCISDCPYIEEGSEDMKDMDWIVGWCTFGLLTDSWVYIAAGFPTDHGSIS